MNPKYALPVSAALIVAVVLLVLALVSCAPAANPGAKSGSVSDNYSQGHLNLGSEVKTMQPSFYLASGESYPLYGVWEVENKAGQHCTVVADVFTNYADSNSAPAISCTSK